MYVPSAHRSLISFKDLRAHGIHTSTLVKGDLEALELQQGPKVIATAYAGSSGLYELSITHPPQLKSALASDFSQSQTGTSLPTKVELWHRRMGHPGTTMLRRMIPILSGHEVCLGDTNKIGVCGACAQGKMIQRPSRWKLPTELPPRLHRLHGDICGPITPTSGPFRYFMVLVDAAGIHFEVSLLSTRNIVFSKLLAMLIKFKTHHPDFPVKTLRMDNAGEFKSQHFEDYCVAMGIELTYSVPYEHSQNGLAEAFIKKIQLISRPLLLQADLPSHLWAHAVLHAASLLRYRPTLLNDFSPLELLSGQKPDVSHFRVFGCQVWIPTVEPKRTTISSHRVEGVYVGFDSPSIIRYLNPTTGIMHKARFQNCKFDENKFPSVVATKPNPPLEFWAPMTFTKNPDPRTALADTEVKKLLDLKALAERLPDGFTNIPRITRNPLPGTQPTMISIQPKASIIPKPAKQPKISHHCLIQSAQVLSNQTNPQQTAHRNEPGITAAANCRCDPAPSRPDVTPSRFHVAPRPDMASCHHASSRPDMAALRIPNACNLRDCAGPLCNLGDSLCDSALPNGYNSELRAPESDPVTLDQAKSSPDWPKWEAAIQAEYSSLRKHQVFGPLVTNLKAKPVGYKLIFVKKQDAQGNVSRYKARLVAQGFTQRPGLDFEFTYSPVMDSGTFRYLLGMAVQFSLETQLLDVVTAYLYGPLDAHIYIKPPPDFLAAPLPEDTPGAYSGLRLQKALYGLKQSGRMWYKHLHDFLLHHHFSHNQALASIFTLKHPSGFVIIAVYVDDLNLIGTPAACKYAMELLKNQFEMKLLGKTSFCLGLQVSYVPGGGIFLHQTTYTRKLLKRFGMEKSNPISTPMIGRSKTADDPYSPCEEEEEEYHNRTQYLAAVGALLYLSTYTRPDISFSVSVLARHSQRPSIRHWNGVKHLLRYLRGTEDLGLLYTQGGTPEIIGYADAGFRSDEVSGKSQTGYIFLKNNAPIVWKSVKQTVTATSTNHSELISFHEATREAVWLRKMNQIILSQCGITQEATPTIIFEDNAACVAQVSEGFIKSDRVKHIPPELLGYTQELIQTKQIEVRKVESSHNIADVLTKILPAHTHKRLIRDAGMRLLHELIPE